MGPEMLFLASAASFARIVSALLDAALVGGFALLAVGLVAKRPLPLVASALLLFLAAIPLSMGLFGLPVGAASAAILLGARRVGRLEGVARWLARGVGALAAVLLALLAESFLRDGAGRVAGPALVYSALMLLVLAALAVAGWWPQRAATS